MFCEISAKWVGHAELFADAYCRGVIDFPMSRNRTRALSGRIEVDAVATALTHEYTTVLFQVPD